MNKQIIKSGQSIVSIEMSKITNEFYVKKVFNNKNYYNIEVNLLK